MSEAGLAASGLAAESATALELGAHGAGAALPAGGAHILPPHGFPPAGAGAGAGAGFHPPHGLLLPAGGGPHGLPLPPHGFPPAGAGLAGAGLAGGAGGA